MNDDYASGAAYEAPEVTVDMSADGSIGIGDPAPAEIPAAAQPAQTIMVYADSITANSYSADSAVCSFDVVFSVTVSYIGEDAKTYKVVKRIGVDKNKLVAQATADNAQTMVEEAAPPAEPVITEAQARINRAKQLAGL